MVFLPLKYLQMHHLAVKVPISVHPQSLGDSCPQAIKLEKQQLALKHGRGREGENNMPALKLSNVEFQPQYDQKLPLLKAEILSAVVPMILSTRNLPSSIDTPWKHNHLGCIIIKLLQLLYSKDIRYQRIHK